jgi:hypothetical protein
MWVWRHETHLENQHGQKEEMRWSGPYIVHEKHPNDVFTLRELNGVVIRGTVTVHRLKLFYYRPDRQTLKSVTSAVSFVPSASSLVIWERDNVHMPFDNPQLVSFPFPDPYRFID